MRSEPNKKNKAFYILFAIALIVFVGFKIKNKFTTKADDNIELSSDTKLLRVMEYNVENLFDTIDNPRTNDDELTPQGSMRWNTKKFNKKLNDIADVILSMDHTPSFVALTEIENELVLKDLLDKTELKEKNFSYAVSNSADYRGVNLGLLYKKDHFKIIDQNSYRPNIGSDPLPIYTRDILHLTGIISNGDTLDFFICHSPSRGGGEQKTEPNRIAVAETLKKETNKVITKRPTAKLIILGDFNDGPLNKSINNTLEAKGLDNPSYKSLHNLFYNDAVKEKSKKAEGSYKYKGDWDYLDQIIVNGNLLKQDASVKVKEKKAFVYKTDFLLEKDRRNNGKLPYRTYVGRNDYIGGYSDHLPIYMDLVIE